MNPHEYERQIAEEKADMERQQAKMVAKIAELGRRKAEKEREMEKLEQEGAIFVVMSDRDMMGAYRKYASALAVTLKLETEDLREYEEWRETATMAQFAHCDPGTRHFHVEPLKFHDE
ncbi:MAG: hypothetical protein WCT49_05870 [Candidatus Paceibacterota bacterium]|jgi:hypothetical protein|nr:hypothetical protein [Candidatus Paceibacterota bacterium]